MTRYGEQTLDELERFVEAVEAETTVELVFVLAHRAEAYRDVPYKAGAIGALLSLLALIYLPFDFSPQLMIPDLLLGFGLGFLLGRASPAVTRWLTTARRREEAVLQAARAAFNERGVSLTRERTGLLLFVSWLERRVELLPDVGVEQRVPLDAWNAAWRQVDATQIFDGFPGSLAGAFAPVRVLLGEHLPPSADNPDEIPNRPVVI